MKLVALIIEMAPGHLNAHVEGKMIRVDRFAQCAPGPGEVWAGEIREVQPRGGGAPFSIFVPIRQVAGFEASNLTDFAFRDLDAVLGVRHQGGAKTYWQQGASRWAGVVYWPGVSPERLAHAQEMVKLLVEARYLQEQVRVPVPEEHPYYEHYRCRSAAAVERIREIRERLGDNAALLRGGQD